MSNSLIYLPEPQLLFRHNQPMEDPRDGLTLFGPLNPSPRGIEAGVIGTTAGIERFRKWCERAQRYIPPADLDDEQFYLSHPPFPGFQAAFRTSWPVDPVVQLSVDPAELQSVFIGNVHERVFRTVKVYADRILRGLKEEDITPNIWFVIVPDDIYKYCRPESRVETAKSLPTTLRVSPKLGRKLGAEGSLFAELIEDATPYQYEPNFHNQLKARLLSQAPIQILRESTIAHRDFLNAFGKPTRNLDSLQPNMAWNISTAVFYKAGGRPWKMAEIRKGVCYIGLVFKQDKREDDPRSACCAAQMFLDSGDGIVFKGAVGPWYSPNSGEYHLDGRSAYKLVRLAVEKYMEADTRMGGNGEPPRELFLHGRVRFEREEWQGFLDAAPAETKLVGIQIRPTRLLKLYRNGDYPLLRGLAFVENERKAYLWTNGFIPKLQTYLGKEVPNPILINTCRGEAPIETVLKDIMALTKLNYNTCKFSSASPVTIRFADAVGEILTAGPVADPPLSFRYYI